MFYAQEVEQRRPDVKVVDINLLRRSWYFDYLRHAYPGLIERSRDKIEAFVANLKEWERDPRAFATSEVLTRRITGSFEEMLQAMVTNENRLGPVYITQSYRPRIIGSRLQRRGKISRSRPREQKAWRRAKQAWLSSLPFVQD